MGVFEMPAFARGTTGVPSTGENAALSPSLARRSVSAVKQAGVETRSSTSLPAAAPH